MAGVAKQSKSFALAAKLLHAALTILRDNGKELPLRDLLPKVGQAVDLDDWAKGRYVKSGQVRWETVLQFYSIDSVKAGHLLKKGGIWYLTPEGEDALALEPEQMLEVARAAYAQWKSQHPAAAAIAEPGEPEAPQAEVTLEGIEQVALDGLQRYVNAKNPYEFQDLVAALLRGMGYYTPFVAPKGKDGGLDVIAYRDPLGTESPRIRVQVKHKAASASTVEVRQLMGLLQKQGDVGIFVSSSGFTPDAKSTARSSLAHVELIDLDRLIGLWQEFYPKLNDADKALLPLVPLYFLAPAE